MTVQIVHQSCSPKEFAKQFHAEMRFYSRKWSQQVCYPTGGCEYDEGYNKFIKVIIKSGEEISGKLTYLSWDKSYLKIFPPILRQSEQYIWQYQIPLENIISISVLDCSFPYKFAYDWHAERKEFPKFCLVAMQLCYGTIIGRLLKVYNACISNENFFPITFDVARDPENKVVSRIQIGDIRSIRVLPYTHESLLAFEQDKHQIIGQSLEGRIHSVGISLIAEYLNEDIPDELPRIFYDYLGKTTDLQIT